MDADTEQFIRNFYADFVAGELSQLERYVAEDVEFVNPPDAVEGGVRRGRESVLTTARALHDEFAYESGEIQEIVPAPNGILVAIRFEVRGRASGLPMDEVFNHVLQVRDSRLTRLAWFRHRSDAEAEAGL